MHCQYMYSAWLPAAMPDRKSNRLSDVHGRQGVNGGAGGLIDKFSGKREMIVGTNRHSGTGANRYFAERYLGHFFMNSFMQFHAYT
jgi:hypothetical protein